MPVASGDIIDCGTLAAFPPGPKWNGNASKPLDMFEEVLTVEKPAKALRGGNGSSMRTGPNAPVNAVWPLPGVGGKNTKPLLMIESALEVAETKDAIDS